MRDAIVAEARSWLGAPWLHQGRTRRGIDCAGLITTVGKDLGLMTYDTLNYGRRTQGTAFLKHFQVQLDQKGLDEALPGDILLFRDGSFPCHASIVGERTGGHTIIHAHALMRKVVEDYLHQSDWLDRRVACFEYRGLGT